MEEDYENCNKCLYNICDICFYPDLCMGRLQNLRNLHLASDLNNIEEFLFVNQTLSDEELGRLFSETENDPTNIDLNESKIKIHKGEP